MDKLIKSFVLMLTVFALVACGENEVVEEVEAEEEVEKEEEEIEDSDEVTEVDNDIDGEEEVEEELIDEEQDNIDKLEYNIGSIVSDDLDNTTITDLRINENASIDEEGYIVLIDLEWSVKNKSKTTKQMLDMYSDHLAAKASDDKLINQLVIFWTVPYHNENESILKRAYQNEENGMFLSDEMNNLNIFE